MRFTLALSSARSALLLVFEPGLGALFADTLLELASHLEGVSDHEIRLVLLRLPTHTHTPLR